MNRFKKRDFMHLGEDLDFLDFDEEFFEEKPKKKKEKELYIAA